MKLTGLQDCFVAMRELSKREEGGKGQSLQIEIDEGLREYSLDSLECHEAGFDSLMTGYSFLKGVAHLSTPPPTQTPISICWPIRRPSTPSTNSSGTEYLIA
jgi:hypothetical protein